MSAKKEQIKNQLKKLGIEHDPIASEATLESLIPKNLGVAKVEKTPKAKVTPERKAAWEKFCKNMHDNDLQRYARLMEAKELDEIPDSFIS